MLKEKSQKWQQLTNHLGYWFSYVPLPPKSYTWLALPLALLGLFAIIEYYVWLGIALYLISGLFGVIDGAVDRYREQPSQKGTFLDGSINRFVDFIIIFSYFWLNIDPPWLPLSEWLLLTYFFVIMPTFEMAYANHQQTVTDPDEQLVWRLLNRGEMYLFMMIVPIVSIYSPVWAGYILVLFTLLSAITTLQTIYLAMKRSA